jgi:hypothetical protein
MPAGSVGRNAAQPLPASASNASISTNGRFLIVEFKNIIVVRVFPAVV